MVINKSIIWSDNPLLVFQITCWQTLVNAIAQISSCCNPWRCYKCFYNSKPEDAAPHRIHIANTWMAFNVCRAFSQLHYIPLKDRHEIDTITVSLAKTSTGVSHMWYSRQPSPSEENADLTYLTLLFLRIQKPRQIKIPCLKEVEGEELKKIKNS